MLTVRGLFSQTCIDCGGASGHPPIPDDGYLVCFPCVLRGGREASQAVDDSLTREEERIGERLDDIRGGVHSVGYWMHIQYHAGPMPFPGCRYCDRRVAA